MKDDRELILKQLRKAKDQTQPPAPPPTPPSPPTPPLNDLITAFTQSAEKNSAQIIRVTHPDEIPDAVRADLDQRQLQRTLICEQSLITLPWQKADIKAEARPPKEDDTCGITHIIAAAADSGAMLQTDAHPHPHALTISLLPPHHIAILPAERIVQNLPALWQYLPKPLPRGCCLISGPSRTADIEQTLTLGAHGPISVSIIIITPHASH